MTTMETDETELPKEAYFLSLTVENLRCFGDRQTLDLSDGNGNPSMWNVILGENGTGKTSILWFLTELSPRPYEKNETNNTVGTNLYESIKHSSSSLGVINITPKEDPQKSLLSTNIHSLLSCHIKYNNSIYEDRILFFSTGKLHNRNFNFVSSSFTTTSYGGSRLLGEKSLSDSERVDNTERLLNPLIPLPNAEDWLVQADYAAKLSVDSDQPAKRLEMVKSLLCELLPDVEDFKFGIAPGTTMTPRVEAKTPYGWVRVRDLSLGYQTALAWIVDFASRMMDSYPESENPFAEPAICLVDEIDLHTHPRWQRELAQKLRKLFPKTQFIVTAHSPLIVQAVEDANIALLRREGDQVVIVNDVDHIRNWRVDQILSSDLFSNVGAESAKSERLINERTTLVEKGNERIAAEEARLREIDAELDQLPVGSTAEDRDAMAFIRDAASWLKETKKA